MMQSRRCPMLWVWMLPVVFLCVILAASQTLAAGAPPEKKTLTIGVPGTSASFFPNKLANLKDFYKEQGFESVKILTFQGNGPTVQALAGGTIDLCVASLHGLLNTINAGQDFKAFWGGYNMTEFNWYGQTKYKSIKDAKGGTFGVSRFGSLTDSLTRYAIKKAGLDPAKDVNILQSGDDVTMFAALDAGKLDVGILSTLQGLRAEEKGLPRLYSQKDDIAKDYPTHVVYAKQDFIGKNPNTIKAYLRGVAKAIEWIRANQDEAAKILSQESKMEMKFAGPSLASIINDWKTDGSLPQDGMKVFWEIAISLGDAKEVWPDAKWLDDSFMKTRAEWLK